MINVYTTSLNRIGEQFLNVGTATLQFANDLGKYYINGKFSKKVFLVYLFFFKFYIIFKY